MSAILFRPEHVLIISMVIWVLASSIGKMMFGIIFVWYATLLALDFTNWKNKIHAIHVIYIDETVQMLYNNFFIESYKFSLHDVSIHDFIWNLFADNSQQRIVPNWWNVVLW